MSDLSEIKKKAEEAKEKPATYGPDIDLERYTTEAPEHDEKELSEIEIVDRQKLLNAGVDISGKDRSGTFIQVDSSVIHSAPSQEGIEVIPTRRALEIYPWLEDYLWKVVQVNTDKYTARAELEFQNGYFIRALPGVKSIFPVQACLYLKSENINQNIHNIIIAEENSELDIINGCANESPEAGGLHIGISEFYIRKGAKITFSMIHNWTETTAVRPRSGIRIEENGVFVNNYVCMHPVESLQLFPTAFLVGKGATARFSSILLAEKGVYFDVGSKAILSAPEARCEMVSRALSTGGTVIARGSMVGEVPDIKGHLECRGMILKGEGRIHSIPELDARAEGVDMSHEAAVGKIAREEIEYLMARGLTEEEAVATIVRGFMRVDIEGLPPILKEQIDRAIEIADKSLL
ncbi:MAG: SufD family Fe-S cluster assembly protein [Actinomycetota bacterium]|nr:SufD family Fe-S cluster assembly protein [Actinomycetota bacterium]